MVPYGSYSSSVSRSHSPQASWLDCISLDMPWSPPLGEDKWCIMEIPGHSASWEMYFSWGAQPTVEDATVEALELQVP